MFLHWSLSEEFGAGWALKLRYFRAKTVAGREELVAPLSSLTCRCPLPSPAKHWSKYGLKLNPNEMKITLTVQSVCCRPGSSNQKWVPTIHLNRKQNRTVFRNSSCCLTNGIVAFWINRLVNSAQMEDCILNWQVSVRYLCLNSQRNYKMHFLCDPRITQQTQPSACCSVPRKTPWQAKDIEIKSCIHQNCQQQWY